MIVGAQTEGTLTVKSGTTLGGGPPRAAMTVGLIRRILAQRKQLVALL